MAKLTSHTLNGSDGTHAGSITVTLRDPKTGDVLLTSEMDTGGRLSEDIPTDRIDPETIYELVFDVGPYWTGRGVISTVQEIALRFSMPDPNGSYHMPIIFNPNSYSMWMSA
ncbi:MAG: hydroxyisourate hydrolase [Paracoccaceae bacterium]|nr:hydroxyisourate hydrolase [Paracoccaceae bacterium]MDG1738470.1 hydroxyisourate hydrolase [Paracoccaceae bacterium]MDG2259783.1 hydroxyisourate hydrolase [Paracoccaceae bacterium]